MELTEAHRLLLKAAFLADDSAVDAWRDWHPLVDWEGDPDPATYRLLAKLQSNIKHRSGIHHLLNKFAGVARKNWFKNQQIFAQYDPLVSALVQNGIFPIIDPYTAITLLAPDTPFDRSKPVELSVSRSQLVNTIAIAESTSWTGLHDLPIRTLRGYLAWYDQFDLKNVDGFYVRIIPVDSGVAGQTRSLESGMMPNQELTIWRLEHSVQSMTKEFLQTDQSALNELSYFCWLTNLALLICASGESLDLNNISLKASEAQLQLIQNGLGILTEIFPDRVSGSPADVKQNNDGARATDSANSNRYGDRFGRVWGNYVHNLPDETSTSERLISFPAYVMARWGLSSYKQLPQKLSKSLKHRFD